MGSRSRWALQAGIAVDDAWAATLTPWAIGAYWNACLVVPLLLLWALYWAFTALVFPYPFATYLDWLQSVMTWSDALWRNLAVASAA
ncbi:MAG TPA: hypothetical protein PKA03_16715 [Tabrizicola sp.]|nr:hypothetical protein [Tabrizicola sp.]